MIDQINRGTDPDEELYWNLANGYQKISFFSKSITGMKTTYRSRHAKRYLMQKCELAEGLIMITMAWVSGHQITQSVSQGRMQRHLHLDLLSVKRNTLSLNVCRMVLTSNIMSSCPGNKPRSLTPRVEWPCFQSPLRCSELDQLLDFWRSDWKIVNFPDTQLARCLASLKTRLDLL